MRGPSRNVKGGMKVPCLLEFIYLVKELRKHPPIVNSQVLLSTKTTYENYSVQFFL